MYAASPSPFNIAILGTGGVGGYLGGMLAQTLGQASAAGTRVFFLARGRHLAEIQEHGLILNTAQTQGLVCRPTLATADPGELPLLDLAVICVKSYDLPPLLKALQPKIGAQTVVLPLLNGVDIGERIRSVVSQGTVLRAGIYISAHVERPGVVTQEGETAKMFFGPDPANPEFSPERILALLGVAGITRQWLPEPEAAIWGKFFFIAPFALVTAFSGETVGEVAQDPELLALVRGVMREISALAGKHSVRFEPNFMETTLKFARSLPPGFKTSFQRDLEIPGHPNEGDLFGGTILRLGKRCGLETPLTRSLYQAIISRQFA
ncbi:MAG: 2-dehydropantoate 2-reductase [Candidatus Firestonebacteria bacterium]|nr:2-dehydropantoate 2-reductase [Candidatus Firestonebacteria bacterium]